MLSLPQELTHDSAPRVLQESMSRVDGGETAIDCGALTRFDSAALAVLLALRRHAARRGIALTVHNLPDGLASLADVYGISSLLND